MARTRKNARGAGTIRKRSKNCWEGRYTTGFDPQTGKQVQGCVYGKTQKEVRERLSQITVEIDTGKYLPPTEMTIGEWMEIWKAEYMADKKWSTVKHYAAQINKHIVPALGRCKLSELSPHMVQAFVNSLLRGGKDRKPLSPKSVRNVHGVLPKALAVALRLEYIRRNPAESTILPRIEKTGIKPLTDEQVGKMIAAAGNDAYGVILKFILMIGVRLGEAMGLTWDCVDFERSRITINKQLQKRPKSEGGYQLVSVKNDKVRVIAPAPSVMKMLSDRQKAQMEQRLMAGAEWQGWHTDKERETALVFTNELGVHLHDTTIRRHFKLLAADVGAPDARIHDLRHTFAVISLQNGDDVKTVQGNMGHASAAFTLDVYGHVSERMKEDSAARMEAYLVGLK